MSHELVSAIVPAYNGEQFLADALDSIFAQTYRPLEVIVVDDGSTDESAAIAHSYDVRYLFQENRGVSAARNRGVAEARGAYLSFLDQDDLWAPHKVETQVDYLRRNPDVGFAISRADYFLQPGTRIPPGFKKELLDTDHVGRLPGTLMTTPSIFEEVGLFDTDLAIANDVDWFARAEDRGVEMGLVPEVLLHRRLHEDNLSSNAKTNNRELLSLLRRSIDRKSNP